MVKGEENFQLNLQELRILRSSFCSQLLQKLQEVVNGLDFIINALQHLLLYKQLKLIIHSKKAVLI